MTDSGHDASSSSSAKERALADEQRHLDAVHDRVEVMRRRARERVDAVAAQRFGSTFQAQFERDVTAHHHAARASRFTFGDVESLVFGRLDMADGDVLHIGKVSVIGADGDVLLVDWRAPAAAPFYQATAARPEGVVRRRTLATRGRKVIDLDDEILDGERADALGLEAATGQGALLAALERRRDNAMHDIVATIQADQDAIIRAPAVGTLVVTGGPGTGKTVVALHRVASLLYRDRDRFAARGVLVVGPSQAFTDYTSNVLPALGEHRVVQRPLSTLCAVDAVGERWDTPEIAALKGRHEMVEVCRQLVIAAMPPLTGATRFSVDRVSATVSGRTLARMRSRLLARIDGTSPRSSYRALATKAQEAFVHELWKAWIAARRALPSAPPGHPDDIDFAGALDSSAAVIMLRRTLWPDLEPEQLLRMVAAGSIDLARAGNGLLSAEEAAVLTHDWRAHRGWSAADIALIDELAALIGPRPKPRPSTDDRADDAAWGEPAVSATVAPQWPDLEQRDYRDFAHVVVDEAQDLTTMQWRALARRGEYASWTVVGDLDQKSLSGGPHDWHQVAAMVGRRQVAIHTLTINYRTPAEIADVAAEILRRSGGGASPQAVRTTGRRPRMIIVDDILQGVAGVVSAAMHAPDGATAVLTTVADAERVQRALAGADRRTDRTSALRVLDVRTAKGLEFDHVIVADPDAIVAETSTGWRHLYIAVTRATRELTIVARPETSVPAADRMDVTRSAGT